MSEEAARAGDGAPLKIAVHLDGPSIRGNERQLLLIVRELLKRGHRVVASCRPRGPVRDALRELGVPTTARRPRGDLDPWNALRFASWLRRERPDVVLLTSWKRAPVAAWAARRARVPRVVLRLGAVHRWSMRGPRGRRYAWALARYVDELYVNSLQVAEWALGIAGVRPEAVRVIPNGIVLAPADPAPLRAELGLAPDALLFAGVGALGRIKGFDVLVEALARAGLPELHLAVAGEGPEREALGARAAALGVADRFHLLGQRGDVAAVLAAADGFVLSSRSEGMSVAMLEAMTAGVPVVATDVGGVRDALAPQEGRGPAGWIVPSADPAALAAALREVASALRDDPGAVRERVAEAHWRMQHWLTVDAMMAGVEAALRGAPHRPRAAAGGAPA